jgi:hypothetical protein
LRFDQVLVELDHGTAYGVHAGPGAGCDVLQTAQVLDTASGGVRQIVEVVDALDDTPEEGSDATHGERAAYQRRQAREALGSGARLRVESPEIRTQAGKDPGRAVLGCQDDFCLRVSHGCSLSNEKRRTRRCALPLDRDGVGHRCE